MKKPFKMKLKKRFREGNLPLNRSGKGFSIYKVLLQTEKL